MTDCDLCEDEARYQDVVVRASDQYGLPDWSPPRALCQRHHDDAVVVLNLFHIDIVGRRLR